MEGVSEMLAVSSSAMAVDIRLRKHIILSKFIPNWSTVPPNEIFRLQANSTREFSEHATQGQGSEGSAETQGKRPGGEDTGSGGGDSKSDKQTVVDHMAKIYASDPNDLRSRITDRCKPRDETDAVH